MSGRRPTRDKAAALFRPADGDTSGDVPPGALFYLLRRKLFDDASLEKMLYQRSGLLGLSGVSGDMRVLQESKDPPAIAAVESFIYAMTK